MIAQVLARPTLAEVRARLDAGALVEFIEYHGLDLTHMTPNPPRFGAYVCAPTDRSRHDFGSAKAIEEAVGRYTSTIGRADNREHQRQ